LTLIPAGLISALFTIGIGGCKVSDPVHTFCPGLMLNVNSAPYLNTARPRTP
jgi:hypothetical protein